MTSDQRLVPLWFRIPLEVVAGLLWVVAGYAIAIESCGGLFCEAQHQPERWVLELCVYLPFAGMILWPLRFAFRGTWRRAEVALSSLVTLVWVGVAISCWTY